MKKHWCPVCDQGWVEQVTVAPIHKKIWLCGECEALWPTKKIEAQNFTQFSAWLKEQGVKKADAHVIRAKK